MAISDPVLVGSYKEDTNSTTIACTITAPIPSGAKVWVAVGFFPFPVDSARTIQGVSDDGAGGTLSYNTDRQAQNSVNTGVALISADAPAGRASGTVFTVTLSGSCGDRAIAVFYSTGVATGIPAAYGGINHDDDNTSAWSTGNITVLSGDIEISVSHFEDSVAATSTPSGGNSEICDLGAVTSGSGFTVTYQRGTGVAIQGQGTWSGTSGATVGTCSCAVAYTAAAGAPNQQLRPDADLDKATWDTYPTGGNPLYAAIDEASAGGDVIRATAS